MLLESKAAALEQLGFVDDPSGGVYSKTVDKIVVSLWEITSKREPDRFAVKMGIWIEDPFLDQEQQEGLVALAGFLTGSGAAVYENARATWWRKGDTDSAFKVLLEKGVPDLLELADIKRLIEHFEDGLTHGIKNTPVKRSWINRLTERIMIGPGAATSRLRFPPVYNYYLSLLYFHIGDISKSAEFASTWLEHVKISPVGAEPDRTYEHLEKCRTTR